MRSERINFLAVVTAVAGLTGFIGVYAKWFSYSYPVAGGDGDDLPGRDLGRDGRDRARRRARARCCSAARTSCCRTRRSAASSPC